MKAKTLKTIESKIAKIIAKNHLKTNANAIETNVRAPERTQDATSTRQAHRKRPKRAQKTQSSAHGVPGAPRSAPEAILGAWVPDPTLGGGVGNHDPRSCMENWLQALL